VKLVMSVEWAVALVGMIATPAAERRPTQRARFGPVRPTWHGAQARPRGDSRRL